MNKANPTKPLKGMPFQELATLGAIGRAVDVHSTAKALKLSPSRLGPRWTHPPSWQPLNGSVRSGKRCGK
jgi:hypothetical protein